jgi:hypothetical protein
MASRIRDDTILQKIEKVASADNEERFLVALHQLKTENTYSEYQKYLEKHWLNITEVLIYDITRSAVSP